MADLYICNGGNNCGNSPSSSQLTKLPKMVRVGNIEKVINFLEKGSKLFFANSVGTYAGCFSLHSAHGKKWAKLEMTTGDTLYLKDFNPRTLNDIKKKVENNLKLSYGTKIVAKTRSTAATYRKKTTLGGYGIYEQTSSGGTETYYVVE